MKHQLYFWTSQDGLRIFGQAWLPPDEAPRAIMLLLHGLGEHSSRYKYWVQQFVDRRLAVMTFDWRGHGFSQGRAGYAASYELLLSDLNIFFKHSEALFPEIPKIFYAISMGGNLLANYLIRHKPDITGAIIASAWLQLSKPPSAIVRLMAGFCASFCPKLSINTKMRSDQMARNTANLKKQYHDPLLFQGISVRLFRLLYTNGIQAIKRASAITCPLLIMHGTNDPLTSPQGSKTLAGQLGHLADLQLFEGFRHSLHRDENKQEVFNYILQWVNSLLSPT